MLLPVIVVGFALFLYGLERLIQWAESDWTRLP
jgi:hypothetical protein